MQADLTTGITTDRPIDLTTDHLTSSDDSPPVAIKQPISVNDILTRDDFLNAGSQILPVHVRLLRKRSKQVTTISGLPDPERVMMKLRKKFSCGGSVADGIIQLQGDLRDRVCEYLRSYIDPRNIFSHGY